MPVVVVVLVFFFIVILVIVVVVIVVVAVAADIAAVRPCGCECRLFVCEFLAVHV